MFSVSNEPILLSQAGIHGMCVSLNTPVLNIEELPVGPAQAAIVLFDTSYGGLGLGIGIRSVETRQVLLYAYQGAIDPAAAPADSLETAASFAEGMGFLFDEDMIGSEETVGRGRALALWMELTDQSADEIIMDEPAPAPPPQLSPAVPLEGQDELVLDDFLDASISDFGSQDLVAGLDAEDGAGLEGDVLGGELLLEEVSPNLGFEVEAEQVTAEKELEPSPAAPVTAKIQAPAASSPQPPLRGEVAPSGEPRVVRPARKRMSLSKFRQAAQQLDASAEEASADLDTKSPQNETEKQAAPAKAPLGRIPLVRVRQPDADADAKPNVLIRLLSSF